MEQEITTSKVGIVLDWTEEQATDAVVVKLTDLDGEPSFVLKPADEFDVARIQYKAGVCRRCNGRGFEPVTWGKGELRSVACPACRGKTKSMSDDSVRLAVLTELVVGWTDWLVGGREFEFGEKALAVLANVRNAEAFVQIIEAAKAAKARTGAAEGKASGPGREPA